MSPLLFNSRRIRTLFGFFGLVTSSILSAQTDLSSAPNLAISLPALVDEITANNPERRFYLEEIAAAKIGRRYSATWSDPELSFDIANRNLELAELGLSRFEIALKSRARTLAYSLRASQANATAIR